MELKSMTKVLRTLVGGGLAAVFGMVLLGAGVFTTSSAHAESPPNPPSRFAGTVSIDGKPVPAGTAIVGAATCGTTSVTSDSRYVIDVAALDPGANPNCGADGSPVTFFIGDKKANETGTWDNGQLSVLNLTYTTPTPTATPTTPAGGATTPAGGGGATTPKAPTTGSGVAASEDGSNLWLLVALGAGVMALGFGGAFAARRSR
jgi:hypothetical protein